MSSLSDSFTDNDGKKVDRQNDPRKRVERRPYKEVDMSEDNHKRALVLIGNSLIFRKDAKSLLNGELAPNNRPQLIRDVEDCAKELEYLLHRGKWATVPNKKVDDKKDRSGYDIILNKDDTWSMGKLLENGRISGNMKILFDLAETLKKAELK